MWTEDCAVACRRHPELVGVYEAPDGALALLLRHSLMPLPDEYARWLDETVVAADAINASLRAAGVTAEPAVLQWLRAPERGRVLREWRCRYNGDSTRHAELLDVADCWSSDRGGLAVAQLARLAALESVAVNSMAPPLVTRSLLGWYRDMMPTWLSAEPVARRQLLLVTHRWIVEHVLAKPGRAALSEVNVGPLGRELARTVAPAELARWAPWVRLVQRDLERALRWFPDRRGEPWVRWLFLIPYSVPVPSARLHRVRRRRPLMA